MAEIDEHEASRTWIRERLIEFAAERGVEIEEPDFLRDGPVEFLHVRGHRQHVTATIGSVTLDELHHDPDEQAQMGSRLRNLIANIPKVGDRIVVETIDGLYDVLKVVELGVVDVARSQLKSLDEAWQVARGHVEAGGRVWIRRPNSTSLEPFSR